MPVDVPGSREDRLARADQFVEAGDAGNAAALLLQLLVVDPQDVEVLFRLASVRAAEGNLQEAIEYLAAIPEDHPEAGLPAIGQSADWYAQLQRYDEAEQRYRRVLELFPQAMEAHRQLAYLYNRQGRRHEAAVHVYELCRNGDVRQDELHSLIHLSDAMYDDPASPPGSAGEVRYWPIGQAAEARKLFMERKYGEAVDRLHEAVVAGDVPPSIVAFYGRAAAEAQDEQRSRWWLDQVDAATREYSEYWAAVGLLLLSQGRHDEAARALLEAVDRDPTDRRSIARLRSVLETLGRVEEAARWESRLNQLHGILLENNRIAHAATADVASLASLADKLDAIDRSLEAVLWRSIAAYHQQLPRSSVLALNQQLKQLVRAGEGYPSQATRLCHVDRDQFPLPRLESIPDAAASRPASGTTEEARPHPARFENIASEIGLEHAYQVASTPLAYGFSIYQSMGGAVAVIDYDLDGNADLYFTQGGADPPEFIGQQSNVLYRNLAGKLSDVKSFSATAERRYSTGVTSGDWNQDGFADLVVANIGANTMFLNNGDGTFRRASIDDRDDKALISSSLAMADLTGDALPDVFEVNYLHDPEVSRKPRMNEAGQVVESLMPQEFRPGMDRVVVNQGSGPPAFRNIGDAATDARAGLGVIVGDFDHRPGNEIFVGNDVYPNQWWTRDGDSGRWTDAAMLNGSAYGYDGSKTASMGIAAADFDRNGWLDFHITNFQDQNASLFLQDRGAYQDRNVQFGLAAASHSVLGFGTQAIDYDNDGKPDLVVANGHIENAVANHAAFEQPAQLFCNLGSRFELVEVADASGYWSRNHLGRGLARVDFDRDGRNDFVVTHLGETSALLLNRTTTTNHWLQLCLRGVTSERDAIGARIELRAGGRELSEWVVAGDGFFSRNEPLVCFGLGDAARVEELRITWPTGQTQTFRDVQADVRFLAVEHDAELFRY
jgi:tetratricopeptide (TPR) repeat protein